MTREEAEGKLKSVFGIDHFYDDQWHAIDRLLRGERILMIQRTGFGKSLFYQFPATLFAGVTVVFSPLIALMRDQVRVLNQRGISAAFVNSEQSPEENTAAIQRALNVNLKILYIAPERQENQEWLEATKEMNLSMVVIDEAHTISTWGHDFRPSFRRIINLVRLLPASLPVLATTATATKRVQHDIEQQIGGCLTTIRGDLNRHNLCLHVIRVQSEDEKMIWLASNLNNLSGTGLIYTGTRVDTEIYSKWLDFVGISSVDYNAGLDSQTRRNIEEGLRDNRWKCVVTTNALGMGIDKPDIRFIIHTQMPSSPIHYYQEIGRAGRDGKQTIIILFYNETKSADNDHSVDYCLPLSFIEGARPSAHKYHKVIEHIKEEPLTEREIMKRVNLKQGQIRVIKADLIDQNIIREVLYGKTKKYEYQFGAGELDTSEFERLRLVRIEDLDSMVDYVYTDKPRMEYLCRFLDNDEATHYSNCDNTNLVKLRVRHDPLLRSRLEEYRETYFPYLDLADDTFKQRSGYKIRTPWPGTIEILKDNIVVHTFRNDIDWSVFAEDVRQIIEEIHDRHFSQSSRLTNGFAASYYGVSSVGAAIHRSKYEGGGDFPDFLLKKVLSLLGKKYKGIKFDMILYVPPTNSGDLVRNFAIKVARIINVPVSHDLKKTRHTAEQKMFQNTYNKRDNVRDAFDIDPIIVKDKCILLIDDIYDSGVTLKEVGLTLTKCGAKWIVPIVIAKTTGGTL